jgi:hypothetical protein
MLGMPVEEYAKAIAEALAVIHWRANVTAYDIEFVIGSTRTAIHDGLARPVQPPQDPDASTPNAALSELEPTEVWHPYLEGQLRTQLWVLDFNHCGMWEESAAWTHPEGLIDCLVEAYFENDPYYPLPCAEDAEDQKLWLVFRRAYGEKAQQVLERCDKRLQTMPRRFLTACEEREQIMLAEGRGHGSRDQKQ